MSRLFLTFCSIGLMGVFAISPAQAQQTPEVLAPSSGWNVDFADDSCTLFRQFGEGDRTVLFELAQYQPGRRYIITLASKSLNLTNQPALYRFFPATHFSDTRSSTQVEFAEDYSGIVFDAWLEPAQTAPQPRETASKETALPQPDLMPDGEYAKRAERITAFTIDRAVKEPMTLLTGPMGEAIKIMDQCMADLVVSWGLPQDAEGNIPAMAGIKDTRLLARAISENFPRDALRAGVGAIVRVRLMVGAKGKPTSCHVQTPVKYESFERTTCQQLMRKARFKPALDEDGTPIPSYYITSVSFYAN